MKIKIYQINREKDPFGIVYSNLESMRIRTGKNNPDFSIYDLVWSGTLDQIHDLEDVYIKFNTDIPDDFNGRSMSVSDIVEIVSDDVCLAGFYYCNSIGFEKVRMDNIKVSLYNAKLKIEVLMVEPGKGPYTKMIEYTETGVYPSFEFDKNIVTYYNRIDYNDDLELVCKNGWRGENNEKPNRRLVTEYGEIVEIHGPFMVISKDGSHLTDDEIRDLSIYLDGEDTYLDN